MLINEVKELLGAKSLPSQTYSKIFEKNNGVLILVTSPWMMPQSKHIVVKYQLLQTFCLAIQLNGSTCQGQYGQSNCQLHDERT